VNRPFCWSAACAPLPIVGCALGLLRRPFSAIIATTWSAVFLRGSPHFCLCVDTACALKAWSKASDRQQAGSASRPRPTSSTISFRRARPPLYQPLISSVSLIPSPLHRTHPLPAGTLYHYPDHVMDLFLSLFANDKTPNALDAPPTPPPPPSPRKASCKTS
jgi:hypothetical protein